MGRGSNAARAVGDRAGLRLGLADQVLHALEAAGRRDQHVRKLAERDDGREVLGGVERQLGVRRRHDGLDRGVEQQRVAVRVGLGGLRHAERTAGARPVLEHKGLADLLADLLEYRPADGVERGARRERYDKLDRLAGRPVLRGGRGEERDQDGGRGDGGSEAHG